MKFLEFFDPLDINHLKAYQHLQKTGTWPEGFIPKNIEMDVNWYLLMQYKMADLWVGTNIFIHDMKPDENMKDKIIDFNRLLKIGKNFEEKRNKNARKSNEQSS
jgi:hypothetical protein